MHMTNTMANKSLARERSMGKAGSDPGRLRWIALPSADLLPYKKQSQSSDKVSRPNIYIYMKNTRKLQEKNDRVNSRVGRRRSTRS